MGGREGDRGCVKEEEGWRDERNGSKGLTGLLLRSRREERQKVVIGKRKN